MSTRVSSIYHHVLFSLYSSLYCICHLTHEYAYSYAGLTCENLKTNMCNLTWINPNIKRCLETNGATLSKEILNQYRYNTNLHGIPPCYRLSNMDSPEKSKKVIWKVKLICGFENTKDHTPRKCNGTTASGSIANLFCLEDTSFNYWYVNDQIGKSMWASSRAINVYGRIQFYGITDFSLQKIPFYTEKLNGTQFNGPTVLNITIDPHLIYNALPIDSKKWGRYYGEFKLDYDRYRVKQKTAENLKSIDYWGKDGRAFILIDQAEYRDDTLYTKVILKWWHYFLIVLSIMFFLFFTGCGSYIIWKKKFKED